MRAGIYILNEDDAKELSSIEISDKVKEVFNNAFVDDRQSNREWSDIIRTSEKQGIQKKKYRTNYLAKKT